MALNKKRFVLTSACFLWTLAVGLGLSVLWRYENAPGQAANPPARWPTDSCIHHASDHATLIMLAHPHCPCTRASIEELAKVMTQAQGRVNAYVLFLKPTEFSDNWEKTYLWEDAARIAGVTPVADDDGVEALRFHALTSGQTVLYDADGRLLFSGGITGSRGHSGDNAGQGAIVSLLNHGEAGLSETFVFGCPLFHESECKPVNR
jgi:hypothetical protein